MAIGVSGVWRLGDRACCFAAALSSGVEPDLIEKRNGPSCFVVSFVVLLVRKTAYAFPGKHSSDQRR